MNAPLDTWMEHKGRVILDEREVGFFVYKEDKWIKIVEVFRQKTASKWRKMGLLYSRSHKLNPQTLAMMMKTKKGHRRITFEVDSGIAGGLIQALGEIGGTPTEAVGETVKSAKDKELEKALEKMSDFK